MQGLVGKSRLACEDAGKIGLDGCGLVGAFDRWLPGVEFVEVDQVYPDVGVGVDGFDLAADVDDDGCFRGVEVIEDRICICHSGKF